MGGIHDTGQHVGWPAMLELIFEEVQQGLEPGQQQPEYQ